MRVNWRAFGLAIGLSLCVLTSVWGWRRVNSSRQIKSQEGLRAVATSSGERGVDHVPRGTVFVGDGDGQLEGGAEAGVTEVAEARDEVLGGEVAAVRVGTYLKVCGVEPRETVASARPLSGRERAKDREMMARREIKRYGVSQKLPARIREEKAFALRRGGLREENLGDVDE